MRTLCMAAAKPGDDVAIKYITKQYKATDVCIDNQYAPPHSNVPQIVRTW
jgi:hypothetical protein